MKKVHTARLAGVLALLSASHTANAAVLLGADALKEYNLIVLGDLTSSSEVEGRAFVGGNLGGGSSNYYTRTVASRNGTPALTVYGNVTGDSKSINNGGGALIGHSVEHAFNLNGANQTVLVGGSMPLVNVNQNTVKLNQNASPAYLAGIDAQRQALNASLAGPNGLSASLALLGPTTSTASLAISGGKASFTATGSGLNVIDLDGAKLNSFGEIAFSNAGTTVINVSGDNLVFNDNFLGAASGLGQNVIWNLYEATSVSFSNAFYGSVLAPKANATLSNFIEGSAVFGNLTQNGELHLAPFEGTLPPPVPEPASWAMMIGGFGLIGGAMRRRRRASAVLA